MVSYKTDPEAIKVAFCHLLHYFHNQPEGTRKLPLRDPAKQLRPKLRARAPACQPEDPGSNTEKFFVFSLF